MNATIVCNIWPLYHRILMAPSRCGRVSLRECLLEPSASSSVSHSLYGSFACLHMLVGIAASPTDLVKVQLQLDGKLIAAGKEPRCCVVVVPSTLYNPNRLAVFVRYKGTIDAFRTIASQGGVKGLWKGWVPNCQRAALVQIGDLTTYDAAKQFILRNTSVQVCLVLRLHCTQAVFTSL